jgi:hypothetical protein
MPINVLSLEIKSAIFWLGGLYITPTIVFFPSGLTISTNKDSTVSALSKHKSSRILYSNTDIHPTDIHQYLIFTLHILNKSKLFGPSLNEAYL